ncbi:YihY/virulence factor BrkB family protein [Agromyces sp. NPDC055520]
MTERDGEGGKPAKHGPFARLVALGTRLTHWALALKPARAFTLYLERHGPMLADSVTYRVLFSVFAGVFLGFAIAGIWLAGNPDALEALVETVDAAIPGLFGEGGIIAPGDVVQPLTLSIAGILALVGLVGAAIGAIGSLRTAFRRLGDQPDDQTFFVWVMARDLLLAIGFGAGFVAAAAVTVFSTTALGSLLGWLGVAHHDAVFDAASRFVSIAVTFTIDTLLIVVMFRLLSGMRPGARPLWTGALLGGLGLSVLQVASSLFVGGASSNPLLASFGSLIALLIWLNLSSQVILMAGAYIVIGADDERRGADDS